MLVVFFFFQAEDGIRDLVRSRGLGDVYKRQGLLTSTVFLFNSVSGFFLIISSILILLVGVNLLTILLSLFTIGGAGSSIIISGSSFSISTLVFINSGIEVLFCEILSSFKTD